MPRKPQCAGGKGGKRGECNVYDGDHATALNLKLQNQQLEPEKSAESAPRRGSTSMVEHGPVPGLDMWHAPAEAVRSALSEVRPRFHSSSNKSSSDMFEVGWSFHAIDKSGVMRIGRPLADFPCLRALILTTLQAFTPDDHVLGDETLNIICRRYTRGQSLPKHVDRPQLFDEHVYGCILHNTSDRALSFEQQTRSGNVIASHVLEEQPGLCFRTQGPSRYEWIHGVDELSHGERISITWRWIRQDVASEGQETAQVKGASKGKSKGKSKSEGKEQGNAGQQAEKKGRQDGDEPPAPGEGDAQDSRRTRWGRKKQ